MHHLAGQILEFLERKHSFGLDIQISDECELLLDTGGGLKNAVWFFDDDRPFLVHNVDILTDIDLGAFYDFHLRRPHALASLAVSNRPSTRCLLFDRRQRLCGWRNRGTGEVKIGARLPGSVARAGLQRHTRDRPEHFFLYAGTNRIFHYRRLSSGRPNAKRSWLSRTDHRLWLDVGKKEQLERADEILQQIERLGE